MKDDLSKLPPDFARRSAILLGGIAILGFVYIFQRHSPLANFGGIGPNVIFALNRTTRLILNDLACLLIIHAIFRERKYLRLAFIVFLGELFLILPAYLFVKLSIEGDSEISSPLLSAVHRLVVNPMLMILLVAGLFYQRLFTAR